MSLTERKKDLQQPIVEYLSLAQLDAIFEIEQQTHSNPWSRKLIENEFENESSIKLGLFIQEQLKGYCFSHLLLDEVHVLNIAVAPDFQDRGFGTFLLTNLLEKAKAIGCKKALLEVRPSNLAAIKIYREQGFKVLAVRRNYYRDNQEDALILEKTL